MMFNKKGVSAVVANVLIILLVVVGVALIWAAVRPSIEKGAEGIQSDCLTTSLAVTKCTVGASGTIPPGRIVVTRNAGGVEDDVTKIRVIHRNNAGVDSISDHSTTLGALEGQEFLAAASASSTGFGEIIAGDEFDVVAVINGEVCQVMSTPITC